MCVQDNLHMQLSQTALLWQNVKLSFFSGFTQVLQVQLLKILVLKITEQQDKRSRGCPIRFCPTQVLSPIHPAVPKHCQPPRAAA